MSKLEDALWREMLSHLRRENGPVCRHWFDDLQPGNIDGGMLTIHTSNGVERSYLQRHCTNSFMEAAQAATGALVAVCFTDVPAPSPASIEPVPEAVTAIAADAARRPVPPAVLPPRVSRPPNVSDEVIISPDYSFDTFVTGPENALAHSAAVAVANQPGTSYNPLFIHGGVGLGKTHLLQAICRHLMTTQPDMRICYLSCDAFVTQFLDCVQQGQMSDFRHRYRHVDLLVIDDIHFLANRERTQEEFFHTFNELHQLRHQIVLSSDSPPHEIPQLEDRLVSRFQSGMVAPVAALHFETRVAIIRAKAALRGLTISDDVISYIATRIDSNARELEGAVTTLQGHAALHDQPIDIELARNALGDPATRPAANQASLQHVLDAVTTYYNVRLSDLQSKRRQKSITGPRQVCMWLARRHTRFSLEEIGGYLGGRDHTTVLHSVRTVDQRLADDPNFARQLEHLETRVASALKGGV